LLAFAAPPLLFTETASETTFAFLAPVLTAPDFRDFGLKDAQPSSSYAVDGVSDFYFRSISVSYLLTSVVIVGYEVKKLEEGSGFDETILGAAHVSVCLPFFGFLKLTGSQVSEVVEGAA
jgi:hypothetical protein